MISPVFDGPALISSLNISMNGTRVCPSHRIGKVQKGNSGRDPRMPEFKTTKMASSGGGGGRLPPPPRLKHFVMTEKLGQGTYATVYKAYRKVCTR